ncbi:MAG TPA: 2Fe-2S iron-sulfur cluster-binding protein [Actinomycetota bacterium]
MALSPTTVPLGMPRRLVDVVIDGEALRVPEGSTILDACRAAGVDTPTMCYADNLTPVNACRVCVVEVEGGRTLVPSCSRPVEPDMQVRTDTERVRHSRRLVMEFLASSVDTSLASADWHRWVREYGADPDRFGARMAPLPAGARDRRWAGHHDAPEDPTAAETVAQPVKVDNELYVRDYERCVLCYKCVEACGADAQHTFAIAIAGRGFDARVSTEYAVPLDESACVYCGNCIGVCPTGALMFKSEFDMRDAGTWDEERQTVTNTICPYCGVGCELEVHVQDDEIVKVTSPADHSVTAGHLCVKGRFGFAYVQRRGPDGRRRDGRGRGPAAEDGPAAP